MRLDDSARARLQAEPPASSPATEGPAAATTQKAPKPEKPNPIRVLTNMLATACHLVHADGHAYLVPGRSDMGRPDLLGTDGIAQPFDAALRRRILRISAVHPDLPPVGRAIADTVMDHLQALAFDGPEQDVSLRFHHDPGAHRVCVDLGREDGHVIVIEPGEWAVGPAPAGVIFRRSHATKPLPLPVAGGSVAELAALLALGPHDEVFRALLGWVVGLPFTAGVRPGALLVGPYGSGKSTRLRLAVSIFEPSPPHALGSAFGRSFGDDQVRALHRAAPLWDNLTAVSGAVSDALCCLVTGTARETRALYSDNDLNVIPIARPLGLTAVGVPAGLRPDALDRLVVLDVPAIAQRVGDAELQLGFDEAHGRLLGAMCDAVAAALAWQPHVPAPTQYRMASHAHVLTAVDAATAAGALGFPPGLLAAYTAVTERSKQRTVAEDTFGSALLDLLDRSGGQWRGKASELLMAAGMHAPLVDRAGAGWPSSARRVPEVLNHLRDGLLALGVTWSTTTVRGSTHYIFAAVPTPLLASQEAPPA